MSLLVKMAAAEELLLIKTPSFPLTPVCECVWEPPWSLAGFVIHSGETKGRFWHACERKVHVFTRGLGVAHLGITVLHQIHIVTALLPDPSMDTCRDNTSICLSSGQNQPPEAYLFRKKAQILRTFCTQGKTFNALLCLYSSADVQR